MYFFNNFLKVFFLIGLIFINNSFAHTYLNNLVLDGNALDRGDCLRPQRAFEPEDPLPFVYSPEMTCGWLPEANNPANRKCPVSAGSTIGIQWYHNHPGPDDNIIDSTHKGPCLVYMAKSTDGSGPVWFKIFEQGLDSNGLWCTDHLIANRGLLQVTIPSDLIAGDYLLRGEITALHNADVIGGAQLYVSCAELTLSGTGTKNPSTEGVAFPGYYQNSDPGFNVNLYGPPITSYTIPGPPIYHSGDAIVPIPQPPMPSTTGPITGVNSGIVSSCGPLSISQTFRSYWSDPDGTMHQIYDLHILNTGSSTSNVQVSIQPNSNGVIEEVWNMRSVGGNNYIVTEPIDYRPSLPYTGAGYVSRAEASIALVCSNPTTPPSTSSSSSSGSSSTVTTGNSVYSSTTGIQKSSTTGSHQSNPSTTTTTTGNHVSSTTTTGTSSKSCKAGISFSASNSWTNGGNIQINVRNTGTKPITSIKLHISGEVSSWNLDETVTENVFTLPSWATPLQVGASYTSSGFTFSGHWNAFVVNVSC